MGHITKGDAYQSEVTNIHYLGRNEYVHLIFKWIPVNVAWKVSCRSEDLTRNEIAFYETILPTLIKFQSTKCVKYPFNNCARLFLTYADRGRGFVVIEDLKPKQFKHITRQDGMDYEHCRVTMRTLAKFHAISFAMKDQEPDKFEEIRNTVKETHYAKQLWGWYKKFWHLLCSIAIDAVEKEYPNSIYVQKVRQFATPSCYKHMIEAVNSSYCVITHGDCRTNNFLYKYDGSQVVDVKMIDFQLTRCTSPVLDVASVIYACTTQELRFEHYNDLLEYYHKELSSHINELGSNPSHLYPWEVFLNDVKAYSFFGLAYSFEALPFMMMAHEDAFDMDVEGNWKKDIVDIWPLKNFAGKDGRRRVANNVVHCVDNGYI